MLPQFKPQDRVIVSTLPYLFLKPKKGHVILFFKDNKKIMKRIEKIEGERIYVSGDNKNDSLEIGWIKRNIIIGKVIFKFR